jgi:hypothetical protein
MRRQSSFAPTRRRRSPVPMLLLILVILFFGFLIYLGMRDNEVPVETIEQDVTNEVLAR